MCFPLLEGREDEDNINQVTMGLIFLHLLNHVDTIDRNPLRPTRS